MKKTILIKTFALCLVLLFFANIFTVLGNDSNLNIKDIYLTFDDGPSTKVTNEILDILKEEKIKGTFFIIGSKIQGREDIIKRINNEGHSIGLHTFTHKYKKIYSSNNEFIEEMQQCSDAVEQVIGICPKIIRFPTGSNGHLSKGLLEELHRKNYKIYDWNLSLSDGLNSNTLPDKLYRQGTKPCVNPKRVFLLLHCDAENKNTCKALKDIIKFYKNEGYSFKPITSETMEYYFKVKK